MRVMQWKAEPAGYQISPALPKEELSDIKQVIMVYDANQARRRIADMRAVQKKLWNIFKLEEVETILVQH